MLIFRNSLAMCRSQKAINMPNEGSGVAQSVERSLQPPENLGSNPSIRKFHRPVVHLNRKDKKRKRCREWPIFIKTCKTFLSAKVKRMQMSISTRVEYLIDSDAFGFSTGANRTHYFRPEPGPNFSSPASRSRPTSAPRPKTSKPRNWPGPGFSVWQFRN